MFNCLADLAENKVLKTKYKRYMNNLDPYLEAKKIIESRVPWRQLVMEATLLEYVLSV